MSLNNSDNWEISNILNVPETKFYDYAFDEEKRILILLQSSSNHWGPEGVFISFYQVTDIVVWKNTFTFMPFVPNYKIQRFSYNSDNNYALLIYICSIQEADYQVFSFLKYDTEKLTFHLEFQQFNQTSEYPGEVIQAELLDQNFVIALFNTSLISILEVIRGDNNFLMTVKNYYLQQDDEMIHGFDLIQNNFLVIYSNLNQIKVYQLKNFIELNYKMKIPLYDQFKGYSFFMPYFKQEEHQQQKITESIGNKLSKSFYQGNLAVLMFKLDYESQTIETKIFFWSVTTNQHNSLQWAQDFSYFYNTTMSVRGIQLINNFGNLILFAQKDNGVILFEVDFQNLLMLPSNPKEVEEIIQKCSDKGFYTDSQGQMHDKPFLIESLDIFPISLFDETQYQDQSIKINITTQNQGLAITQSQIKQQNISYSYDNDKQDKLFFLLENALDGFNVTYMIQCYYQDYSGQIQSCSQGVSDLSQDTPKSFYIEFVTSQRQITKFIDGGGLFCMFDSNKSISFLDIYNQSKGSYQQNILNQKLSYPEQEIFGCQVSGKVIQILVSKNDKRSIQLLILQCTDQSGQKVLKIGQFIVFYKEYEDQRFTLDIGPIPGAQIYMAYEIIDADVDYFRQINQTAYNFILIMTFKVPNKYTNLLQVYNVTLDIQINDVDSTSELILLGAFTADDMFQNTFLVNQIQCVPNTTYVIITLLDQGFAIFDFKKLQLLQIIKLQDIDKFYQQIQRQQGAPLNVFSIVPDWPFSFHIISNYGIYIYYFNHTLNKQENINQIQSRHLSDQNTRIIRMTITNFNYEMVSNKFGYCFLAKKYLNSKNFNMYLVAVSFYSGVNSKVFKMIYVSKDVECNSLNIDLSVAIEDEIQVNFICGTQLYQYNVCMRPHLEIDLSQYKASNTINKDSQNLNDDSMYFNQFNLSIKGFNQFSSNTKNIILKIENLIDTNNQILYILIMLIVSISLIGLVLLNNKHSQIKQKIKKELNEQKQLEDEADITMEILISDSPKMKNEFVKFYKKPNQAKNRVAINLLESSSDEDLHEQISEEIKNQVESSEDKKIEQSIRESQKQLRQKEE